MNRLDGKNYFVQPVEASQRRYEALRSVFVEEQPLKEVAQRFGISYGTVRNWVSEFYRQQAAGQSPPFSPPRRADVPRPIHSRATIRRRTSKSPMCGRCRWRRDVG